jgi:hypothetical protein
VHDFKLAEAKANGVNLTKQVIGAAQFQQSFNVQSGKGKKEAVVFGSRII